LIYLADVGGQLVVPEVILFQRNTGDDPLIGQDVDEAQRWLKKWAITTQAERPSTSSPLSRCGEVSISSRRVCRFYEHSRRDARRPYSSRQTADAGFSRDVAGLMLV